MAVIKYNDSGRGNFTPGQEYDVLAFTADASGDVVAVVLDDNDKAKAVPVTSEFAVVPSSVS